MFEDKDKPSTPNASHETFRGRFGHGHAFRHKYKDMEMTKAYYTNNPPKVGDKVVVLKTASHSEMYPPEHYEIEAITDRGRIVVDHEDAQYGLSGKSFYKSGQNCMKPKGQIWLIPEALYEEDYISREDADQKRDKEYEGKSALEIQLMRERSWLDAGYVRGGAEFADLPDHEIERRQAKAQRKFAKKAKSLIKDQSDET